MVTKPYLLKIIIDTATESNDNSAFSTIMLLGLIYLVVMFVGVLVTNFYNYIGLKLYPRLTVEITRDVLKNLIWKLPMQNEELKKQINKWALEQIGSGEQYIHRN